MFELWLKTGALWRGHEVGRGRGCKMLLSPVTLRLVLHAEALSSPFWVEIVMDVKDPMSLLACGFKAGN